MEVNNTVERYVALIKNANGTSLIAGQILPSTKATTEFRKLDVFTMYRVNVFAVDKTGQPYKGSELLAWTDQGGELH